MVKSIILLELLQCTVEQLGDVFGRLFDGANFRGFGEQTLNFSFFMSCRDAHDFEAGRTCSEASMQILCRRVSNSKCRTASACLEIVGVVPQVVEKLEVPDFGDDL